MGIVGLGAACLTRYSAVVCLELLTAGMCHLFDLAFVPRVLTSCFYFQWIISVLPFSVFTLNSVYCCSLTLP